MLYRSIVFLHGVVATVAGAGAAFSPGWLLFERHFGQLWDLSWRLHLQAKSLMFLMGAGYFGLGVLLLAALWVRDRKARVAVAVAILAGDVVGGLHALVGLHNFGDNVYSAAFFATYAFLFLSALVLVYCLLLGLTEQRPQGQAP